MVKRIKTAFLLANFASVVTHSHDDELTVENLAKLSKDILGGLNFELRAADKEATHFQNMFAQATSRNRRKDDRIKTTIGDLPDLDRLLTLEAADNGPSFMQNKLSEYKTITEPNFPPAFMQVQSALSAAATAEDDDEAAEENPGTLANMTNNAKAKLESTKETANNVTSTVLGKLGFSRKTIKNGQARDSADSMLKTPTDKHKDKRWENVQDADEFPSEDMTLQEEKISSRPGGSTLLYGGMSPYDEETGLPKKMYDGSPDPDDLKMVNMYQDAYERVQQLAAIIDTTLKYPAAGNFSRLAPGEVPSLKHLKFTMDLDVGERDNVFHPDQVINANGTRQYINPFGEEGVIKFEVGTGKDDSVYLMNGAEREAAAAKAKQREIDNTPKVNRKVSAAKAAKKKHIEEQEGAFVITEPNQQAGTTWMEEMASRSAKYESKAAAQMQDKMRSKFDKLKASGVNLDNLRTAMIKRKEAELKEMNEAKKKREEKRKEKMGEEDYSSESEEERRRGAGLDLEFDPEVAAAYAKEQLLKKKTKFDDKDVQRDWLIDMLKDQKKWDNRGKGIVTPAHKKKIVAERQKTPTYTVGPMQEANPPNDKEEGKKPDQDSEEHEELLTVERGALSDEDRAAQEAAKAEDVAALQATPEYERAASRADDVEKVYEFRQPTKVVDGALRSPDDLKALVDSPATETHTATPASPKRIRGAVQPHFKAQDERVGLVASPIGESHRSGYYGGAFNTLN